VNGAGAFAPGTLPAAAEYVLGILFVVSIPVAAAFAAGWLVRWGFGRRQ
jgi:hypothetical protein